MNSQDYEKLPFNKIADKCLDKSETPDDYWSKCYKFVRHCNLKPWERLTYKQVNWLQNIISELEE